MGQWVREHAAWNTSLVWGLIAWVSFTGARGETGAPMDIAPFGFTQVVTERGGTNKAVRQVVRFPASFGASKAVQVEWTEPRDVRAVQVGFAGKSPAPEEITIEWWHRIWPDNGTGGWMKLDDPFNGQWARGRTRGKAVSPTQLRFEFLPLDASEVAGLRHPGFAYRHAYKIRISSAQPAWLDKLSVFSDAVERRARLRFEWDLGAKTPAGVRPRFEARNGRILKTVSSGPNAAGVEVVYAEATNRLSADRGVLVCRRGETNSFSVFVDDVLREGGLYVRDIGAFVSDATLNLTWATWEGPRGEVWKEGTVAEQVARMPEQSFEQVMRAIPAKPATYLWLGVPNLRQEIALGPKGDIRLLADSLRSPGPDLDRRPWSWKDLVFQFSTGAEPLRGGADGRTVTRRLAEGWLPVVVHEWRSGELAFTQTCVASTLVGNLAQLNRLRGTEPVVLATRFEVRNSAAEPCTVRLWLEWNHPWRCRLEPDGTLALSSPSDGVSRPTLTPVRGHFNTRGRGQLELVTLPAGPTNPAPAQVVRYEIPLSGGEAHTVELFVPYIELLDARELTSLKALSFEPLRESVVSFWKARVAQGMTYEVPDKFLNEFFKANLWHVLISTDLDPVTGHHQHGAATHHYKNYLNETMMVARSLEMRGEHDAARELIEPFLECQGVKGLPGNFKSQQGVLYAAHPTEPDPYTAQGYNMHHGWGLWGAAEHYFWTKDVDWLRRVADRLVQGCNWITRERRATKIKNPDGSRPVEYGLAPAGDLEDVEEYLYFYATDAYYYLGMKQAALALARAEHGQARRLAREAEDFAQDIRRSVAESVATSPVVRLKDGTFVPFVPPRVHGLTHLKEGWIREGLYPALHLVAGGIYPETHPFAGWMIEDLEDNIFLSKESGYGVEDPRANFFHFGGFTLQPNLLDLPLVYLRRDQTANFLRGFYNTGWASLYPEGMCFAEWVPYYGKGGGPVYKTPDECKFIQWLRDMLILERDGRLELGLGVPRAWMADGQRVKVERAASFFGRLDLELVSHVAQGGIKATVKLVATERPESVWLRLRHPVGKPIRSATVNGHAARVNGTRQLIELPADTRDVRVMAQF